MEKRIALEKRGRTDDQITELILDNCRSTYIDGLTDEFTALETLSLINVGLVSLKNFPKLCNLRKLELSDNRISNGLIHLTKSPKLTHLNLSGNRIVDFEELQPLKDLENLECLDLFNNQVTLTENYRDKMFMLIPSLSHLDGFDKDFSEALSEEEEEVADDGNQHPSQFSINGIEIDLDELEELESRIRQKRSKNDERAPGNALEELECNLEQLKLGTSTNSSAAPPVDAENVKDDLDELYEDIQRKQAVLNLRTEEVHRQRLLSFVPLLLMFASLLAMINQICFRDTQPLSAEKEDDHQQLNIEEAEEEDSCDGDSEVSLAFLYNDRCADDEVDEEWKCALERDLYNPPSSSSESECEACEEDDEDDQSVSDGGETQDKKEQDEAKEEVKEKDSEGTTDKAEASSKTAAATDATDKDATAAIKEHESEEARGKKRKLDDADTDG
ncbi:acidic leucine-rich nuclear phosphoprotein 32 family member A [Anopheles bellator]|uniref:acidic leucine-rich nuclear phosphoprotein 32 family member A n=1 Tax=Anopheles bellator TaxID=139047 RepID=UPI002647BF20|nr:acidic leucine-rich nuclear phosphoprotein 32 family member A [Anopheles bellator]XP_058054345.1 acidic leucine-rich nuclear phosphoprotein 32 family member A [Anopheles bellator]